MKLPDYNYNEVLEEVFDYNFKNLSIEEQKIYHNLESNYFSLYLHRLRVYKNKGLIGNKKRASLGLTRVHKEKLKCEIDLIKQIHEKGLRN